MRSEPPAQLLARRLGGRTEDPDPDGAADEAVDTSALLPRWLPDADQAPDRRAALLAAIRADPGRAGAVALGLVAAIAVLLTVFTLVRSPAAPVVSAKLPPVQPVSTSKPAPSGAPDEPVVVSVVGLVKSPGVVTLTPGARVADAVSAAGGALEGADSVGLNLARRLADGEQVVVGIAPVHPGGPTLLGSSVGAGARSAGPTAPTAPGEPAGPVDLNTATVEQLDELPGVGPVTAAAIVAWRTQNGAFTSVDQLGEVDGIGPARLDRLRDLVRV